MTRRLRWGVLGTGKIANHFVGDLQIIGAPVSAVGSRDLQRARLFAESHGIPHAHGSYDDLVADATVDVVYVATPNTSHAADALLALDAGKHVLVEKPFALNATEAQIVVELAAERHLVVLEAMWTRWLPHMVRIRELVGSGVLGDIRIVAADHGQSLPHDPAHRVLSPTLGGGALLDLGIYPISFAWDLLGQPDRVLAMADAASTGVDAVTSVILGFAGGAQAVSQSALHARSPITASVSGTEARIEIDPFWYFPSSFTLIRADGEVLERFDGGVPGRGMQFQAMELERLVEGGMLSGEIMPPQQSVAIMATLDEVRRQIGLVFPSERAAAERSGADVVGVQG